MKDGIKELVHGVTIIASGAKEHTPDQYLYEQDDRVMTGLELDGSIRTVIVTANTETPGLGTAVTDRKVQKTLIDLIKGTEAAEGLAPNVYLDWYTQKTAGTDRWPIVKDGEQINGKTGATITSAAISGAVHAIGKTATDNIETLSKGAE